MSEDAGLGETGAEDWVLTNWFIPGISKSRRPSDLEPVEAADPDPDAAAVMRDPLSEAMLEVDAADELSARSGAAGELEIEDESTLFCATLFEAVVDETLPC